MKTISSYKNEISYVTKYNVEIYFRHIGLIDELQQHLTKGTYTIHFFMCSNIRHKNEHRI